MFVSWRNQFFEDHRKQATDGSEDTIKVRREQKMLYYVI